MKLHIIDLLVLAGYLIGVIAMGFYFSKKNVGTEEYFVGGRSFGGWVIGLSLVGTSISSITFLAYPADAYKTGWLRYLPNLVLPMAVFVAAHLFLPFFRLKQTTSAYEYLENRFGPSVRVYGAVAFLVAQLVRISIILYLLSLLMHEISGWDPIICIVATGFFVALYTIMGGIEAVIWTDVVQTLVLASGGLVCLWVIVNALPGGLGQVFSVAAEHGKFMFAEWHDGSPQPVRWDMSFLSKTGTMMLFLGLTNWLTELCTNQNVVQRYCAAKSSHEARKALWVYVSCSLPIWAFYMFLGTALFVFYQQFPQLDAQAMLDGSKKAEQILPYFILHELPVGLVGLVIAAALAAAMSSLDSSLNAISAVGVVDIYRRHLAPDKTDKHYLQMAWLFAVLAGVWMVFGAIMIFEAETKTLQDTGTVLVSLLSGGLLGLYLFGFFTTRGDARAVWLAIASTVAFTAFTLAVQRGWLWFDIELPFDLYYTTIIANLLMFAVAYLASVTLFKSRVDHRAFTVWGR